MPAVLPAYVYMFIEALADGAVKCGMARNDAYEFVAQTVLGSAKMVLETKLIRDIKIWCVLRQEQQ